MRIRFDNNLKEEAEIIKDRVKEVFDIECKIEKGGFSNLFKFNQKLDGYEIQISDKFKGEIILTEKDIFPKYSTSKDDDWVFGFHTNQDAVIISVSRLKTNSDKPSKILKISRDKYKKRIEFIIIHELGHFLIKDKKHYEYVILKNPETGHETFLGKHCPDNKCIMHSIADIRDLDDYIKRNYKDFFCKKCLFK